MFNDLRTVEQISVNLAKNNIKTQSLEGFTYQPVFDR